MSDEHPSKKPEAGSRGRAPGLDKMAPTGSGPVIALRMEGLLVWVVQRVAKFPREHRFTVGDRLIDVCLEITDVLVEASYKRDKDALLGTASRGLVRARVLVRVARALGLVTEAQHQHFARESDDVGRMLGGWIRSRHSR